MGCLFSNTGVVSLISGTGVGGKGLRVNQIQVNNLIRILPIFLFLCYN